MKTLKEKIKDLTYYNQKNELKEILFELEEKVSDTDTFLKGEAITQAEYDTLIANNQEVQGVLYLIVPE